MTTSAVMRANQRRATAYVLLLAKIRLLERNLLPEIGEHAALRDTVGILVGMQQKHREFRKLSSFQFSNKLTAF